MVREIKHDMNPLHVCCRILDLGMGKRLSSLCHFYERAIFKGLRYLFPDNSLIGFFLFYLLLLFPEPSLIFRNKFLGDEEQPLFYRFRF